MILSKERTIRTTKSAAGNGRFGVMAAVTPQKRQCVIAREYPAESSVEAATTPSRWDVTCNVRETVYNEFNGGLKIEIFRKKM